MHLRRLTWASKLYRHYMSSASYGSVTEKVCHSLRSIVGEDNCSTSVSIREQHGRDESYHRVLAPDAVVFPTSVEQVQEIARLCHLQRIPVVPFGTGTGLEGGVGAPAGGVCVDMRNMAGVVEVSREDFYASVEPGVTRKTLNLHLRDTGLFFPVDPGADASLCGMAATNASGTNAVRYGAMKENVLNLQVVIADGSVIHTAGPKGRARKRSAGYNLTNLFVGSEGTLGFITQATLKLYGIPEQTIAAVCSFPDVRSAVDTTLQILQSGIQIARIEFLDELSMRAANDFSGGTMDYPVAPTLFMDIAGSVGEVEEMARVIGELAGDNGSTDFAIERDSEMRAVLWKARHNWYYAGLALEPGKMGYTTDVCVPISKLPQVILETKEDIERSPFTAPIIGHVGDGNFHCMILLDPTRQEEIDMADKLSAKIARRAVAAGGTCTGEHGIGRGKRQLLVEEVGQRNVDLMTCIKQALDPHLIMNPGNVFLTPTSS